MAFEIIILFAFGAMLCWGFGDFLIQRSVRRIGDLEALFFIGLIGVIGLFPFVLNDLNLLFSLENLLVLLLLGGITFVAAMLDFEALKKGKISIVQVVIELELPITIALGFVFFGEYLNLWQFLLIIPIFVGIVLMAVEAKHLNWKSFKKVEKGFYLAIGSAIGMGLINSFTALSARQVSPIMAIWVPWLIIAVISFAVIWKKNKFIDIRQNIHHYKWLIFFMGILDTTAWFLFAIALTEHNIGLITAITESYPAIGVVLGIAINHEKIQHHQVIGAAITLLASILLAMSI